MPYIFKIIEEDARDIAYTYQDKEITERFLENAGDILATGMLISVDKIKKLECIKLIS